MTTEQWNALRRQDALDECGRCRGRTFGDCHPSCRYWTWTATEAEREALVIEAAPYDEAVAAKAIEDSHKNYQARLKRKRNRAYLQTGWSW